MTIEKALPVLLIVLDLAAAAVYGWSGDWRHCIYWASAAVLTASVTF